MEETRLKPKDKWCPMARLAMYDGTNLSSANRFPPGGDEEWLRVRCLGEACAVFIGTNASGYCGLKNA